MLVTQALHHLLGALESDGGLARGLSRSLRRGLVLLGLGHGGAGRLGRGVLALGLLRRRPALLGLRGELPRRLRHPGRRLPSLEQKRAQRAVHSLRVPLREPEQERLDVRRLAVEQGEEQLRHEGDPHPALHRVQVLLQRPAHRVGVVGEGELVEDVDELVAVTLRAVLDGLEVAGGAVLHPSRAVLVGGGDGDDGAGGARGSGGSRRRGGSLRRLPGAELAPGDPRLAQLLAEREGGGVGLVRPVAVAHPLLEEALESEQFSLVVRVEKVQRGSLERVETGDGLALHLEARLALLAKFREGFLHLDVPLLLGEDDVGDLAHAMVPRGARQLVDAPGAVPQAELVELVALVHQLRVNLHQGLRGGCDDAVHVPAPG